MPRIKDGVERMTSEEIDAIAEAAKKEAKAEARESKKQKELKTEGVEELKQNVAGVTSVGLNLEKKATPDKAIDDRFKFKPCIKKGWISMSEEESMAYHNQGVLVGYDPANKIGLIQRD